MICTKCKIDKDENQYQKYWHSTQNKFRIRKHCTECLYKERNEKRRLKRKEAKLIEVSIPTEIIQPVVPELEPEVSIDYSTNPNYRLCRICQQYLELDKFYHYKCRKKSVYLDCKSCINKKEVGRAKEYRKKFLIENGGSDQHKTKPGEWIDEYQMEATFNILKSIGWKLNEENGIWWKEGIKTPDGVFINIKKTRNLIFNNYPNTINDERKKKIFDKSVELRNRGKSYMDIAYEVGVSQTTVYKWLNNK